MKGKKKGWTMESAIASVKRVFEVTFISDRQINFDPRGGVGLKTLGKLDFLVTQGFSVNPVIPEQKKRR
jgi:hypothetical protein